MIHDFVRQVFHELIGDAFIGCEELYLVADNAAHEA